METVEIQVTKPIALCHEIRELIDVHYRVTENVAFMQLYPEVYHLYLTLTVQSDEVQREAES